jgi:hypothetical protein
MQDLPNEARIEELGYFFLYSPVPSVIKLSQALLEWPGVGLDSQGMLDDFPQDSRHV